MEYVSKAEHALLHGWRRRGGATGYLLSIAKQAVEYPQVLAISNYFTKLRYFHRQERN